MSIMSEKTRFQVIPTTADAKTTNSNSGGSGSGGTTPSLRTANGQTGHPPHDVSGDEFPEEIIAMQKPKKPAKRSTSFQLGNSGEKGNHQKPTDFQDQNEYDEFSETERNALIDGVYDTKYAKSFRHFTREALPRADNYRNIMSIQAAYRPTLDELHNATVTLKTGGSEYRNDVGQMGAGNVKFGWIKGVLMRCLLNIWGVMLFLRLSWVVGQAGVGEAMILIMTTTAVTAITAISMSAISTNGQIKGGGTYFMISRSLGPEFGGSIGLIFSMANAIACAMYVVGFCESMQDLLASFGVVIVDGGILDMRIIGCITIVLLTGIVVIGMEWEAKAQIGLLIILLLAILDFCIGSIIGAKSDSETAKGFIGYNITLFKQNFVSDYRKHDGVEHNFFSVFAIFFPAATGILAGANISGDLKDPQKSIPKGTLLAIFLTTISYLGIAAMVGGTVARDATGDLMDFANGSMEYLNCTDKNCKYGLHNSFQVIELVSAFGPVIYAGCFAATLSSALASLVSAPKVFQALCKDKLYPAIEWFGRGYGKNNEPVRGYLLTFIIAIGFILIGELNVIAPLISNFFLAAYTLINFSTFHATLIKPIGWRPTFKYYNMWLSLVGAILCIAVMFLISWVTALITFVVVIGLYLIVSYRKPDVNWGSSTQAQTYKNAIISVHQLNNVEDHVKNYRPQVLVLSGAPQQRPELVDFAYLLTKNISLMICCDIVQGSMSYKNRYNMQKYANDWFRKQNIKAFYSQIDNETFESGCKSLMQATGIGKLRPNIVLLGYKNNWTECDADELNMYFNVIHQAFDMHLAVAILRIPEGLDNTKNLNYGGAFGSPKRLTPNDSIISRDRMDMGSCDSLSKASQASSISDFNMLPNAVVSYSCRTVDEIGNDHSRFNGKAAKKKKKELNKHGHNEESGLSSMLQRITLFRKKRSNAVIDVYWLYDDGGLTLLLPYIITTRRSWRSCKLRVFALANQKSELEFEQRSMASLLAKFRIDYSDLKLLPDITKPPEESSQEFFRDLIRPHLQDETNGTTGVGDDTNGGCNGGITSADLISVKDKTNRYLRLREYLEQYSRSSDLVVMTLPVPRKSLVNAHLYTAWLEVLSQGFGPFLFVRGNQSSVLTFYS